MTRWNPNLYLKEGQSKGFSADYLGKLTGAGSELYSSSVPVVFTLAHLANVSDTLYVDLQSIVSRSASAQDYPYKNFSIKKRSGGVRWISIPVPPLMAVQKWILKNILSSIEPHVAARAFYAGRMVLSHASLHCSASWILKVDIENFFSNISEGQIYSLFRGLNYPKLLAFQMARLCTRATPHRKGKRWRVSWKSYPISQYGSRYVGSLPQGAPTSPALSNLVCRSMDEQLGALADENSAVYSRYADDICFSFAGGTRDSLYKVKREISKILWGSGFRENLRKTKIIPPGDRKVVTGLVINGVEPTIPKEVRDGIKMHLYYAAKYGIPEHCRKRGFRSVIGFRNHLHGLITYVDSISPVYGARFMEKFEALPWLKFEV